MVTNLVKKLYWWWKSIEQIEKERAWNIDYKLEDVEFIVNQKTQKEKPKNALYWEFKPKNLNHPYRPEFDAEQFEKDKKIMRNTQDFDKYFGDIFDEEYFSQIDNHKNKELLEVVKSNFDISLLNEEFDKKKLFSLCLSLALDDLIKWWISIPNLWINWSNTYPWIRDDINNDKFDAEEKMRRLFIFNEKIQSKYEIKIEKKDEKEKVEEQVFDEDDMAWIYAKTNEEDDEEDEETEEEWYYSEEDEDKYDRWWNPKK